MGIEPTSKAWEALVLPLNYTRLCYIDSIVFVEKPLPIVNCPWGREFNLYHGSFPCSQHELLLSVILLHKIFLFCSMVFKKYE